MDHLNLAFDPRKSKPGVTKVMLASTLLDWKALGCSPNVIAWNSKRIKQRFEPQDEILTTDPIAVVAFGPSLRQTWEELRDYRFLITCSGAHKFLRERGIVPTYHVESDPRIHKAYMVGEPCLSTTYLVASICHPRYFDHLEGYATKLWHLLFDDPDIYRKVPNGDWLLTGGNTVGPRSIKIARLLGFSNLHMYGFDGSGRHADVHANPPPDRKYRTLHYEGQDYSTTENLLQHVDLLFQDLNRIPDANYTFHGKGLIQALSKHYEYRFEDGFPLAVVKDD